MYSIQGAYYLTPISWAEFFEIHIFLQSESVITVISFDASHTYWLSSEVFFDLIEQMAKLEELYVQDTWLTIMRVIFLKNKN